MSVESDSTNSCGAMPKQRPMVSKCVNRWCPAIRHHHEGKLFRLDIDLGNKAGGSELKTEYIWLCARCAREVHPEVEVCGDTVKLRLSKNDAIQMAETNASSQRVN